MDCDRACDLLGAYRDGELGGDERAGLAAHIAGCKTCRDTLAEYDRLGRALAAEGRRPMALSLGPKVRRTLDTEDADGIAAEARSWRMPRTRSGAMAFASRAAMLLVACSLSAGTSWFLATRGDRIEQIERDVVSAHVRSLLADSPVQVATSDQHTVRPWFAGRSDLAPDVKDLASQGFPLVGGRLDYVDGRRASVLVYKRRLHTINVFLWLSPGNADSALRATTRNGYTLLAYTRGGVTTWLASDLNTEELKTLASLL